MQQFDEWESTMRKNEITKNNVPEKYYKLTKFYFSLKYTENWKGN